MNYPDPFLQKNQDGKPKSPYYYFVYTDPITGKRKFKSTKKRTKREAKRVIHYFISELEKNQTLMTFFEYAKPFFIWEKCPRIYRRLEDGQSIGKKHARLSRRDLERFVFVDEFSNILLSKIRRRDLLDLRRRLREKNKLSIALTNRVISSVKAILSEAVYREDLENNPGAMVGALKPIKEKESDEKEVGAFTAEEIKKLFSSCPGVWKYELCYDVFYVVSQTGMRSGEIRALKKEMIDFENKTINIHLAWKEKELGLPKWNKKRTIPVTDGVLNILKKYIDTDHELVFCYDNGSRLGETWWHKRFKFAMDKAKIKYDDRNIKAHSLRHSLNTNLLADGIPPALIQAYLGWSSKNPNLTKVQVGYTHLMPTHLFDVVNSIDKLYNKGNIKLLKKVIS